MNTNDRSKIAMLLAIKLGGVDLPDFDDTTGWYDELMAWRSSAEYKSKLIIFATGKGDTRRDMVRDDIIPLVALILQDEKCQDALETIMAWRLENPEGERDENTPPFPRSADTTLFLFVSWYLYKVGKKNPVGYDPEKEAVNLAVFVADGRIAKDDHIAMNAHLDKIEERRNEYREELRREKEEYRRKKEKHKREREVRREARLKSNEGRGGK